MRKLWLAGLMATLLSLPAAAQQNNGLEFENVWVRAMPPFQTVSAAYLTLTNHRDTAVAIVGASSDVAKQVELHATSMIDGMMRMEPVQALPLAPGERVKLAPGGTHLMLFDVKFRLVPGDNVRLCLQLASKEEVCADAQVLKEAPPASATDHQHHSTSQPQTNEGNHDE